MSKGRKPTVVCSLCGQSMVREKKHQTICAACHRMAAFFDGSPLFYGSIALLVTLGVVVGGSMILFLF